MTSSGASSGTLAVDNFGPSAVAAYDTEIANYTESLTSAATNYTFINGRRYHGYKEGRYIFPNDDKETERLDITHKMMEVALHGKLYNSPLQNPRRILDLGTGTGIWAMEISEVFEEAQVIGNDLSPIQPTWVPPNVHFEIDDIESPWAHTELFDFIHARALYAAVRDWPGLMKQVYDNLAPGGYAEFTDFDLKLLSPDNSLIPGSPLTIHNSEFQRLAMERGMEPNPGRYLEKWVTEAGFEDVHVTRIPLPLGTWTRDPHLKEVGCWNYLQISQGLDSFIVHLFTTELGWNRVEIEVLCAKIREQMKDPSVHSLIYLYNVYGRRPLKSPSPGPPQTQPEIQIRPPTA